MFIQQADLFKGMKKSFTDELQKIMVEKVFKAEDFLFKDGEPAQYFYILKEGRIRQSIGEKGHTINISDTPGDAFGWSCLIGFESYTSSAECLIPCTLIRIEKEKLDRLLNQDSESGALFFKRLSVIIGQRLINSYRIILIGLAGETAPSYG